MHGAVDVGGALLRSGVIKTPPVSGTEVNHSVPCVYCHVGGPFAITQVYGNDPALYYMDSAVGLNYLNNHSSSHAQGAGYSPGSPGQRYQGCPSCHSVHGSNTWDPDTTDLDPSTYILRNNPGPSMPSPVTNMDDFCRD